MDVNVNYPTVIFAHSMSYYLTSTFKPLQFLAQKTRLAHIDYEKDGLIN